jgi:regulation of enolase protein 1 (concanavalin A-like superfamily)
MPVCRAASLIPAISFVLSIVASNPATAQTPPEPPWTSQDVGNPSLPGSATVSGGTFTIEAAGADIWGSSDQFHFLYQPMNGDGEVVARVSSIAPIDVWSKAGVMVRESLSAGSKHAYALVSAARGVAFQRRRATGGSSTHTAGPSANAPYWLRIERVGSTLRAYSAADGATWRLIGSETISMPQMVLVGIAVTAHSTSRLTTASVSDVRVTSAGSNQPPSIQLTAPQNGDVFTAPASIALGATASDPDGSVARVDFYSGSNLLGSDTTSPFTFNVSNVAAGTYNLSARATDDAGASATSSAVAVSVEAASSGTLPSPWAAQDVGNPSLAGSARYDANRFIIEAAGSDIWGTSDQFHFAYQPLTGDGEILARVDGIVRINGWSKAGVMMRETLTGSSKHAYALASASYGTAFQRRPTTSGSSVNTSGTVTSTPWVKLQRQGSTFRAYESSDGATWRLINSHTISMASTIYVGLAVTSHSSGARTTGTFSNVQVSTGSSGGGSTPYGGTPASLPGLVQAENFDVGVNGVAYRDNTSGNEGGSYRTTDVDIEGTTDSGGGYNVAWASAGEWLNYTVNVSTAGAYTLDVRVASSGAGGTFHLEANGNNVSGTLSVPNTGGWQAWTTVTDTVTLAAGVQTLRLALDSNGPTGAVGNFNHFRVSQESSNTPPAVTLSAPANGSTFTAPATITVSANASDTDGNVARVDFYAGSTLIGTDTSSPFSFSWSGVGAGGYSLTARATDDDGAATTSPAVSVTVGTATNQPPSVSLTNPANGATLGAPMFVPVTATASDSNGSVTRVDFYVGNTLVASDTTSPYSMTWNLTSVGTYTLTARATDNGGATSTSTAVTVTANPTWAAFTPPADHATAVTSYVLEVFNSGANPSSATPVRTQNIGKPSIVNGEIRVDVSSTIQPLPGGSYFATISAVRATGSVRSTPSGDFTR